MREQIAEPFDFHAAMNLCKERGWTVNVTPESGIVIKTKTGEYRSVSTSLHYGVIPDAVDAVLLAYSRESLPPLPIEDDRTLAQLEADGDTHWPDGRPYARYLELKAAEVAER